MERASGKANGAAADGACWVCARRSWLLDKLSVRLDYRSRDVNRLLELLALEDEQLIAAIAGGWRRSLTERWERLAPGQAGQADEEPVAAGGPVAIGGPIAPGSPGATGVPALPGGSGAADGSGAAGVPGAGADVQTMCRHSAAYPSGLRHEGAPRALYVRGGAERLARLTAAPTVAIVGSARPTDYGMEMARSLARGLAASGVTVVSGFANGIATGAHMGALEVGGPTVTVMAGGVDVVAPAGRRSCYERVLQQGCAVAEMGCGYAPRRWCEPARARTVAGLATLMVVVEADETPRELTIARIARALGRVVAAVPGRVTSPVSRGTNALLREGVPLVRGPGDALDLLYGCPTRRPAATQPASLGPRLRTMLEQVGAGRDTPAKLTAAGGDPGQTLLELSQLELMGLLGRGDGDRYVPRQSLSGW